MKNYLIIGVLVISVFIGGVIIGNILMPQWAGQISPGQTTASDQKQAPPKESHIKNPNEESGHANADTQTLQLELSKLKTSHEQMKIDYARRIEQEIQARADVDLELARLKEGLAGKGAISPTGETKSKKNSPLTQAIRMGIEKVFKNRIKNLKEKAGLSAYQEAELDRMTDELLEKTVSLSVEMTEKMMAGEEIPPELMTQMEKINTQYEQSLKELMTYPQHTIYQEILETERQEQIKQVVKMQMDGMPGMKGITESVNLSQEQQGKVKALLEEKFKIINKDQNKSSISFNPPPSNDKEFDDKIKAVLTPEQYPAYDEYLKQQEEFRKMAERFRPKTKKEPETK